MKSLKLTLLTTFAVSVEATPPAFADVTYHQSFTVSATGMMSMMGSNGTMTTMVSGDHARTENNIESTSAMMRKFAKNANTATIVRLDDQVMLQLAPEKKQYSEVTFEEMRAQIDKSMKQLDEMSGQGGLPVSEGDCQWSEPEMDVKNTGEKQKFAGVKAEQTIISVSQTCNVAKTNKSCKMTWNLEYWNADKMPGGDEALAFQKGMAKAMGSEEVLGAAQAYSRGLLAMFKKGWDEVLQEGGKMDGFPVKTVMSLEMGGENCTTGTGQPIALDEVWGQAGEVGKNAAISSASGAAGSAAGNAAAQSMGNSVGGSIAGSAVGAASRELVSGLFNKMRKKKEKPKPVEQTAAVSASDSVPIFTITTELTGVDKKSVADSQFVVPSGWKKVASSSW
jgi:hypothetical protein